MEKLKITRKNGVALFKVPCDGICPNTLVDADRGLFLLINAEGQRRTSAKSSFTIHSLLNPGKTTKLIGGKKPYTDCEIIAIDFESDFACQWGLGGPTALNCFDFEFKVDAKASAFGEYDFKIDDMFAFASNFSLADKPEITPADVREHFRTQAIGVIQSYLASKVMGRDMRDCQAKVGDYAREICDNLNDKFKRQGVEIKGFVINKLEYDPAHMAQRERLKEARIENAINREHNDGRRDNISVSDAQATVDIRYIDALNGHGNNNRPSGNNTSANKPEKTVKCPRCGEMNYSGANYCAKCGEALNKK